MRVFVTGGTGFVGAATVRVLRAAGHQVTVLLLPGEPATALGAGVGSVRGDITRPETLTGLLDGHDAVVHLAGAVGYGQTMNTCTALNTRGSIHVAQAAVAAGTRRFLHMSSVSVYGRAAGVPIDEDAPLRKIGDPYGDTKIDAELAVRRLAAAGLLDLSVVRPTVLYGPGDRLFLPKLLENVSSGRARRIGRADHRVDLLHVEDAAAFFELLLREPRSVGETYNLNHPSNPTWTQLLDIVADAAGRPPIRNRLPYPLAFGLAAVLEATAALTGRPPRLTRYAVRVIGRRYDYRIDRALALGFAPRIEPEAGLRAAVRQLMAAS